ncbi:MAG: CatB-related O-acetyltransferase [Bacteroidetes bacterium]|nr:CatB-related O-acetyltransferase [Bacteroidota bacterium]
MVIKITPAILNLLEETGVAHQYTIGDFDRSIGWIKPGDDYEINSRIVIEGPCAFYGGPYNPSPWQKSGFLCQMGACSYSHSALPEGFIVGRYSSVAKGLRFLDFSHPTDWLSSSVAFFKPENTPHLTTIHHLIDRQLAETTIRRHEFDPKTGKQYPVIDHDVWIGENVTLGMGIHIGTGAVIASGSIVTRNVPPYAIVAGIPATVKKYRFDQELIKSLLASEWWKYSYADLLELDYKNPERFLEQFQENRNSGKLQEWKPNTLILPESFERLT